MHRAKGLEFDHVYVLGLHQSRMPGSRKGPQEQIPDSLLKESLPPDSREAHVSEMRRLLHVAMTRARKRLVLAWPEGTPGSAEEVTRQKPSPFYEEARAALDATEERRSEQLLGVDENLLVTFQTLRDDVVGALADVGSRMGEMRLDAHLDAVRSITRYMELLKVAALIERPRDQRLAEAIADVNRVLIEGASSRQRELLLESDLDERLLRAERQQQMRRQQITALSEPSLESFIPTRGEGVLLSATDIDIYTMCPLRYKYARVYSIPREQTLQQRFGILVHQVLERFHSQLANEQPGNGAMPHAGADELLSLFESGWRRSGLGDSNEEHQLHEKAVAALRQYHEDFRSQESTPVWFERNFAFRIGEHLVRGRVDRVDRHADGSFELIDYKTGKAKTPGQLKDDIQLSLYQIGAKESWRLEASKQSYYYVLDNERVAVEAKDEQLGRVQQTVVDVAEGIRSLDFEPTPSWAACSICDFKLICPVAEK
jgi:DNA helicase-2/ATP-dependent DNA helicase PcrA